MNHPGFEAAMRRIVTGDDAEGKSLIIVDGPPSNAAAPANPASLYEIWADAATGALDPKRHADQGPAEAMLRPDAGSMKVRWFVVNPAPEGLEPEPFKSAVREVFAAIGAPDCVADQERHPIMHRTSSLDVICVISGEVSLILDGTETRLRPGNVVIQRGTAHAWQAHGGPALMLAVLIERELA